MRYRRAVPEDAENMAAFRIRMLCEKTSLERENLERIRENTRRYYVEGMGNGSVVCWIADCDEGLVGMGCATFFALPPNAWCPDGKTAYLGNIYVAGASQARHCVVHPCQPDGRGNGVRLRAHPAERYDHGQAALPEARL